MDEVGDENEADALRLRPRQNFAQCAERGGVRMTNGDGLAFVPGVAEGQLELLADGRNFGDIIEKGNIAKSGTDAGALRRVVRDRGCSGAAIDIEEPMVTQDVHQFGHEHGVGSGP